MSAGAFREKIDMAVFGPHPSFTRLSFRVMLDAQPDPAPAARALAEASRRAATSLKAGDAVFAAWRAAYLDVGLGEETASPVEILLAWARQPDGVPSQGALRDLVNAFMLDHGLPAAAYDLEALQGDLWLRPSRGCELFIAPGEARPISPEINELILVDSGEQVLARDWHGHQSAAGAAGPTTRLALIHLDLLEADPVSVSTLTEDFMSRARALLGVEPEMQTPSWEAPEAAWQKRAG